MKLILFLYFIFLGGFAQAEKSFSLKVTIGEAVQTYNVRESKTKKTEFDYFFKRAQSIAKMHGQDIKFCSRDYYELRMSNEPTTKPTIACVRSKMKISTEMQKLANMLLTQYGK